jgi:hypothetical protein
MREELDELKDPVGADVGTADVDDPKRLEREFAGRPGDCGGIRLE